MMNPQLSQSSDSAWDLLTDADSRHSPLREARPVLHESPTPTEGATRISQDLIQSPLPSELASPKMGSRILTNRSDESLMDAVHSGGFHHLIHDESKRGSVTESEAAQTVVEGGVAAAVVAAASELFRQLSADNVTELGSLILGSPMHSPATQDQSRFPATSDPPPEDHAFRRDEQLDSASRAEDLSSSDAVDPLSSRARLLLLSMIATMFLSQLRQFSFVTAVSLATMTAQLTTAALPVDVVKVHLSELLADATTVVSEVSQHFVSSKVDLAILATCLPYVAGGCCLNDAVYYTSLGITVLHGIRFTAILADGACPSELCVV